MRSSFADVLLLVLAVAAPAQQSSGIAVHGHVVDDATSEPSPGARVNLTVEPQEIFSGGRQRLATTTDEQGAFAFKDVQPGRYSLQVEKAGCLAEYVLNVAEGKDIAIRLRREGVILGRVTGADGEAIAKAVVEVMTKSYQYGEVGLFAVSRGFAYTEDDGAYRVGGLAPGRYYVRASRTGYDAILYPNASTLDGAQVMDIAPGAERGGVNIPLGSSPRFTLEGRLEDAETRGPAQAKFLRVYSADLITGTFADGVIRGGEFRVTGLKPGRYFLTFTWVGPTNNVTRRAVFPFDMGAADQSGVVLRAMRTTVAGRLNAVGGKLPYGLSVYLEPGAVISAHIGGSGAGANVAPDGTFEMTGVPAGEYHLRVHSGEAASFVAADKVVVVEGSAPVVGLEVELSFSVGSVNGRAVDTAGNPIARTLVVLQSAEPGRLQDAQYRHVYRAAATGEFAITGVAPGEYLLFAWRGGAGQIGDPDLFALAKEKARTVAVTGGSTVSRDAIELLSP